jgi:hypothetical protein
LAPVHSPLLGSGEMDREDVVGIEMASVRLVALLRKEHDRVAESARMRPVQGGRQEVDLRLENVDALEHARGAVFQVLLQHAAIDELGRSVFAASIAMKLSDSRHHRAWAYHRAWA